MNPQQQMLAYAPAKNLLENKIILVTGASSGIGRAASLAFAEHGATVVLVGRSMEKLESVYDEIETRGYPQPAIFPMNLESATEHDYEALRDVLKETFGRLDGLLNNAGELGGPTTPLSNYSVEKWHRVFSVNVTASFLMTKTLLPLLQHKNPSSIVFTGSSVGRKGRAYWGAYSVSKAAIENLMQVFADELESVSNVRVNSINPGATQTKMRATAYPAEDPATVTQPESLMNRYLFLMGKDSEHISGEQFDAQPK